MPLPAGVELEPLLAALKNLSWQAADILLAYARKPMELSVDKGGEGPVTAADLAVNKLLLDGLNSAFPAAPWALLSEETAAEQGSQIIESNEWLWILVSATLVLSLEAVNTSLEVLADLHTTEYHPRIKLLKDISAAAVLIASIFSLIVAMLVFWPHLSTILPD